MSDNPQLDIRRRRELRERILYHESQLDALRVELAEMEKELAHDRIEKTLKVIDAALSRDVPMPKGEYASGVSDGAKMACTEIRKVLIHE